MGVAAVLTFRTHALTASTVPSGVATTVTTGGSSKSSRSTSASGSSASSSSANNPAGSTTTTTSGSGSAVSTTTTAPSSKTATGAAEETRYGVVQVRVTVSSGRITGVETVELTATDAHSEQINAQAVPELRSQVLSAQSGQIDGVSGATFTSEGYEASLQSALDKLGFGN